MKNSLILDSIQEYISNGKTVEIFLNNGTTFKANKIVETFEGVVVYNYISQPNGNTQATTTIQMNTIIGFSVTERV